MMFLQENLDHLTPDALRCARALADWIVANQTPDRNADPDSGNFPFSVTAANVPRGANNWNHAFAIMGLLAAADAFQDEKYRTAAIRMGRYLKQLQIFDPFHARHYGAFREMTPQTPWCYVRDALSAAWAMLELYRVTGEAEYLERARLWDAWFRKEGLGPRHWPLWGVQFDEFFPEDVMVLRNEMLGCFHGGGLNFFYQMYRTTGNRSYIEGVYEHMADFFVSTIQQPDGLFRTVSADTCTVPENDPQNGLHRANDDLGTLGLLGAWRIYGKQSYLDSIRKFLNCVFAHQQPDGSFETSCAATPVVLNILRETEGIISVDTIQPGAIEAALKALFARQFNCPENPLKHGSFDEMNDGACCARSNCYALIVLLKLFAQDNIYLSAR